MKASDVYGRQPMQMDDYVMDKRHYKRRGDCTISSTYCDDINHCGEDASENACNDEKQANMLDNHVEQKKVDNDEKNVNNDETTDLNDG